MSLIKWNKNNLRPSINDLWGDFLNNNLFNTGLQLGTSMPAVNVKETTKGYNLEVAVPGFKKEDFKIDVDDNLLTISSEKKEEKEEKNGEMVTKREFSYSSFSRSFTLPKNISDESITAQYKDGILHLDIPKDEAKKTKKTKEIIIK